MLRTAVLVFATLLTTVALAFVLAGDGRAVPWLFWGGGLLLAILIERWRYRPRHSPLGADWVAGGERFIDPESGRVMQVFYNARTGERRYEAASE